MIAEEVAEVNPDLLVRDDKGEIFTVRYEAVNAMLLNEFLKEHKKVEELETKLAEQEKKIEALTSGLQRVSAQLAAASPSDGGLEMSQPHRKQFSTDNTSIGNAVATALPATPERGEGGCRRVFPHTPQTGVTELAMVPA